MAKYLIVKYTADYADEFDCEGFGLFLNKDWIKLCNKAEKAFNKLGDNEHELYFGTNECLRFSSYDEWFSCFDVISITEEEYKRFTEIFEVDQFGTGSGIFCIADSINESEDYEEDESPDEEDLN